MTVEVSRTPGRDPKVAVFNGTKFATSTLLADRILEIFQQDSWPDLPAHTAQWLSLQREVSRLPDPHSCSSKASPTTAANTL
jgi:ATP-dependent helicase Lhr and Lhr-like helicase